MKRLLAVAAVFLPIAVLYGLGCFQFLERTRIDAGFRLAGREAGSNVVLVAIDPRSLDALGVWPWPRGYHATVLERLTDAGARRVGFDIDFSSRSDPEEDAELARALAEAGNRVVLPVFQQWQDGGAGSLQLTVVEPRPEFVRGATLASINVRPESDGRVRRYESRADLANRTIPSFATALADDPRPDLESFTIDFGISSRSIPRISYVDVLTGRFSPAEVRGKIVVVGSTAVELGDQLAVPVAAALPGPVLQAVAFESLVQGRALVRAGAAVTLSVALLLTLLLAPVLTRLYWRGGLLLTAAVTIALLVAAAVLERLWPILLDVTPWLFTTVGLYGFALVVRIDQQALGLLRQRRTLRRTETLMQHVVQNSFDAILTLDAYGSVGTFNRSAEFLFGYAASEAHGLHWTELLLPTGDPSGADLLARAGEGPTEATGCSRDGRRFPVELVVTPIDGGEEHRHVAVIRDITERKAHQEELQHRATHDPLTDLPNRLLLVARIEQALAHAADAGRSVAVLWMDVDRFQEINDALGHAVGDRLLQHVARRIEAALAPDDTLSRLGGDEFTILLPRATGDEARRVGRSLIDALAAPFHVEDLSLEVEASCGVALYPDHADEAQALIQRAHMAMHAAKQDPSGVVVYGPDQDIDHLRKLTIKGELRSAIDHDRLTLLFQPKVDHATESVIGAEALLRWHHPAHGFIAPDEFTAVAEHSGLIRPLTQWVLERALEEAARWTRTGLPLGVSVNLSSRNLLEEDLPLRLAELLGRHGVAPEQLTLEITESVIMDDPDRARSTMLRIRELGVGIAVDDFGTGYSSLAYLTRLPVTELKIDKSFVMRLESDPGSATIVRSTVRLAHDLGMRVVAEGVESETVWSALKLLGCDVGQGYHFARPVPGAELLEIASRRAGAVVLPPAGDPTVTAPQERAGWIPR
jgi:diguanylate cyclase (GGDEF)-like protein/PAS domain S-box-containing protein